MQKNKICSLLAVIIFSLTILSGLFVGCGKQDQQEEKPQELDVVRVVSDGMQITLKNKRVSLQFDLSNGNLIQLSSGDQALLNADKSVQNETAFGNFTLYLDLTTGDKWETRSSVSELVCVSSRTQELASSEVIDLENGKKLRLVWDISFEHAGISYSGISVMAEIEVYNGSGETQWNYSVKNECEGITVVSMVCAQIGSISEENDFSLFYPMLEGELHDHAVTLAKQSKLRAGKDGYVYGVKNARSLSVSYPGSLSMQLMQLYNEDNGIYAYSKDTTNEFKKLNFGIFDGENEYDEGKVGASLSFSTYPFAEKGEQKNIAPIHIGVQNEGGWYEGADRYRNHLLSQNIRFHNYGETVKNFSGMIATIATQPNQRPTMAYDKNKVMGFSNDIETTLLDADNLGYDNMLLLGWSDKGFDTMYPDFKFMEAMGGESGFQSGVGKAQKNGDRVIAYLNAYSVNGDSEWSLSGNWENCAVKDENGNKYTMGWGSAAFTAMCPMSEGYSSALTEAAARLAKNGVNGLFFDQLMEMPATLCYDRTHGHKTPATAYGEGYEKVFTQIHAQMQKYTDDYIFLCEGINDAYIRYVDLPVGMWARLMKYRLNTEEENDPNVEPIYSMPEITRYTIPTKILGIQNEDGSSVEMNEHSYAFLMGDPILRSGGSTNPIATQLISIYEQYPEIYGQSVYIHSRGISTEQGLEIGAIVGENQFIISIYNPTDDLISGKVRLDLKKIGYKDSEVQSIKDVLNSGITKSFRDGAFTVEVEGRKFVSYIITLKNTESKK